MLSMCIVYSTNFLASQFKHTSELNLERETERAKGSVALERYGGNDLTDFMNDMFFGTSNKQNKTYDLTGRRPRGSGDVNSGFDDSTRSNSGRLTQEWLEEARQVMVASPSRCDSPARHIGSPRFATTHQAPSPLPSLERDPLSRSARRNRRFGESFTREILSKSSTHSRNKSNAFLPPSPPCSPSYSSTPLHYLFSVSDHPLPDPSLSTLPPRPSSLPQKSRFQSHSSLPSHFRRTFTTTAPSPDAQPLSSSHDVAEPTRRRSLSHFNSLPLSPPRNRAESAQRRSISPSTCSLEKIASRPVAYAWSKHGEATEIHDLNRFLQEQRVLIQEILNGDQHKRAKIVLPGPSNNTTSMVAAICYAWLLCYRQRKSGDGLDEDVVVPVMNVERRAMWNLKQASWLFDHAGLDPASLLFADEVDIESLRMNGQHSILAVGQDILSTSGEAGSQCTILTDNYCEDAYDLLQNPMLKKLLLAGILLDTQNLKECALFSMTRDSEAVQLLLAGSALDYRYTLFDQLMQERNATSFVQALQLNYGKHPDERDQSSEGNMEHVRRERKSTSTSDHEVVISSPNKNSTHTGSDKINKDSLNSAKDTPPPSQAPAPAPGEPEKDPSGEKINFFLFRWFGFGSK